MNRIRTMARLICMVLLLASTLSMAACDGDGGRNESLDIKPPEKRGAEESASQAPNSAEQIKIGFAMDTLLEERWPRDRDLFKEAVEALGAEVQIMAAKGDDALQITQMETLIQSGIDVLVVVPHNAEATATIVKMAHNAGIKVIAYDRLIRNAEIDLYVSFDNEQVGELQAEAMLQRVPKGNYVYIGGADTDYNAHQFKQGVFQVLQPLIDRGDIRVVFDQWSTDWTPVSARANMEAAFEANGEQIDAVIAANDATAGGIIEALEARGLAGKIPVAGQDADLAAVQRIVQGTQMMTVYKPIRALAEEAAELAMKLARGEPIDTTHKINNGKIEVPSVLLTPIAVDESNVMDTIIADGFHSVREVYQTQHDNGN